MIKLLRKKKRDITSIIVSHVKRRLKLCFFLTAIEYVAKNVRHHVSLIK